MDTATWENDEVGAYLRLLLYEWVNGGLPDDTYKLSKIVRESQRKFIEKWKNLSQKFTLNGNGLLVNKRMEEVRENQLKYSESRRKNVSSRYKDSPTHVSTHEEHMNLHNDNLSFSSSSSISNKEKEILSCKPDPIPFTSIISYLNSKTKKNFSPKTKLYQQHIRARWHEGKRELDFQKVVDIKCAKWLTDEKMVDYCRPETLFGSKMDSYLQEGTDGDGGTILDPVERIRQIRLSDEADRAAAADAGKTPDSVGIREDES